MISSSRRCIIKWFKHDTDASIDAKLQELLLDYGACGYGLYWYCVELIAQNVNENNITFELEHDARIIARNLNLTVQETKDMMKKMIDLELFSVSKNEKLACYALAKRLDQSMTSNKKFRKMIDSFKHSHDPIMINDDEVMNRREGEEKRREGDKNTKEESKKPFSFKLTKATQYDNLSQAYKARLQIYAQQFENGKALLEAMTDHHTSNGKGFKDWSAAFRTWERNDKKFNKTSHKKQNPTHDLVDEYFASKGNGNSEMIDVESN